MGAVVPPNTKAEQANAALAASQSELKVREAAAAANPTPVNVAAVKALQERVSTDQGNLAAAVGALPTVTQSEIVNQPVTPTVTPSTPSAAGGSSLGGGTPTPTSSPTPTATPTATPTPTPTPSNPIATGIITGVDVGIAAAGGTPPATPSTPSSAGGSALGGGTSDTSQTLTAAQISAIAAGILAGSDEPIPGLTADITSETTETDAWDYLRNQVEDVFTSIEGNLEDITGSDFWTGTAVDLTVVSAGVTEEMEALPAVALAAALLAGEYASGWIVGLIADVFPNPSILGWHPLNFIVEGLTDVANNWKNSAEGLAKPMIAVLMQPIRQITGLFQRSTNATASAHNKVARVASDTLPTKIAEAVTTVEAYTDEQVKAVTNAAEQAATQLNPPPTLEEAKAIIADAAKYGGLTWSFEAIAATAIVAADTYADSLKSGIEGDIASAKSDAETQAAAALKAVQTTLINELTGDEATLSAISTTVTTTVPAEIEQAVNEAQATEQQALQSTSTTIENQIAALQAQLTALTSRIATDEQTIATALSEISTLSGDEQVDTAAITAQQLVIAQAKADIATSTTAISDLETQIKGVSDTLAPVQAAQQLNTAQLAPFEGITDVALPVAIATLASQLTKLQTQVTECMVDNCDTTNPNNIRNVLQDLLGLLVATSEIGFIAEAIKDPIGTANALSPVLDSIDASAVATLDALLSL